MRQTIAAVILPLLVSGTSPPLKSIDPRISVSHVSGIYPRVSDGTYLEAGAEKVRSLGFQNIEIYLSPSVCLTKSHPAVEQGIYQTAVADKRISWCNNSRYANGSENYQLSPKFGSLTQLASNAHYRRVLDMPFRTVFITSDPINYKTSAYSISISKTGANNRVERFTAANLDELYKEFYDLTDFLLKRYNNRERNFVILSGNEMDWALLGRTDPRLTPQPAAVENAIDYWNKIQSAIDAAKQQNRGSAAHVFQGCEVNLVAKSMKGGITATNNVIPHTHCDLYGYSSYDTTLPSSGFNQQAFAQAFKYLKSKAPISAAFKNNNVFISEMGSPERQYPPDANNSFAGSTNIEVLKQEITTALELGAPYINLWTLYDNECSTFAPSSDAFPASGCPGYWMVKPSGATSNTYKMIARDFIAANNP